MKLIIGSSALKHWFPEFPREPKDIDYVVNNNKNYKSTRQEEYFENPVLLSNQEYSSSGYITPDALYTLKLSHLVGWDIFWEKHLFDVIWLQNKGCKIIDKLFNDCYLYWQKVHGNNKRSDLDMSAESFFDNALPKDLPSHDYLHTILNPIPTYTKILKDGAEVDVCENKFNNLSHQDKVALVFEEVALMAYERKFHKDYRISYSRMLSKFVRQHAPLWEAKWILMNWNDVYSPLYNYVEKINKHIKQNSYGLQ